MDISLHTESGVLTWLLVVLVVLVVGQVIIGSVRPVPSSASGVNERRWDLAVFGATGAALGGMLASLIIGVPWAVLNTYVFHLYKGSPPDSFWLPWLAIWSLVPCAVLGYLSGRWWACLGAAPLLVLWPLGTAIASGPADWFLTLPVTAAVAVALSLGSALRSARTLGRRADEHSGLSLPHFHGTA